MYALLLTAFQLLPWMFCHSAVQTQRPSGCIFWKPEDPAVVVAHRDEVSPNSQVDVMEFVAEGPT
jgi:hypothetical protein